MIVHVYTHSATIFGANPTFALVGRYLTNGLGNYGPLSQVDLTACFRGGTKYPESLYEKHHAILLPSLPLVRFLRKRTRIDIKYETAVTDARFLDQRGLLSAEFFIPALKEAGEKLHLMDDRVKRSDNYDLVRFHADVAKLVSNVPTSNESLLAMKAELEKQEKSRLAAMDPWERLDINWDEFHPNARLLLDDLFFWSELGYSPHGNDTGADLLGYFKKWNRRHLSEPAFLMAVELLQSWEILPIDIAAVDEQVVTSMLAVDPLSVSITDDALIAVAFAAIKFRGYCDPPTRDIALTAIKRERMPIVIADRAWTHPSERIRAHGLIETALLNAPQGSV